MTTPGSGSGDLVGGSYPLSFDLTKLLGAFNSAQGNIAARTNLEWPIGSLQDASASLVSGDLTLVAVPIQFGDEYNYVDVFVGATAASTPTHSWAALYTGTLTTAKLVGTQSADSTTTAIPASTTLTYTLGAAYQANATDSPFGYIYVALGQTGSGVSSLISGTYPTAAQYKLYTNTPKLAATISSAGGTAPSTVTLASTSAIATPPVVVLR